MPVDMNRKNWKPGDSWEKAIDDIHYVRSLAKELGGPDRVKRQHDGGRYTVRERIDKMVDPGSFMEAGPMVGAAEFDADGNIRGFTPGAYVMGLAEIDGRPIAIGGDDFTISGGSPHNVHKGARQFTQPLAIQYGIPYVQLVEGVGHSSKSDEAAGHMGLPGGDLWWRNVELLRRVPVAAGIMGSVAGAPAAFALMSHFTVMIKGQSQIFPSGPPVVRRAIGEMMDKEELGGYQMHVHDSGQVDNVGRVRRGRLRSRSRRSSPTCPTQPTTSPRVSRQVTRPTAETGGVAEHHPCQPQAFLRPAKAHPTRRR